MASYSISSATVKQSWVSTRLRSSNVRPDFANACCQALAQPSNAMMSRLLIGLKSFTCSAALKPMAFCALLALSRSISTTAAAPSDTAEQSLRLSGGATIGLRSDTSRQKS